MAVITNIQNVPRVVITGTPGAGKSTVAAMLSQSLSYSCNDPIYYIETGFWYRILGWMHCTGQLYWDGKINWQMLHALDFRSLLVNPEIRRQIQAPEVDLPTAWLARNSDIRGLVATSQNDVLMRRSSKILVGAGMQGDLYFHLQSAPDVGAKRRMQLQHTLGNGANLRDLERLVAVRAEQDHTRSVATVHRGDGVIAINTDDLSPDQVLASMLNEISSWQMGAHLPAPNRKLSVD